MKKKMASIILALMLVLQGFVVTAYAAGINDSSVWVKQGSKKCTLASNVVMLRRQAILNGMEKSSWEKITQDSVGSAKDSKKANIWSDGMTTNNYTYSGITVSCYGKADGLGIRKEKFGVYDLKKKDGFISALKNHPEGIVIYVWQPAPKTTTAAHAVLLTDYDEKSDTFYCNDPAKDYYSKGRIKLADSIIYENYVKEIWGKPDNGVSKQDWIIGHIQQTWMVTGNSSGDKSIPLLAPPTNLKAERTSDTTAKISWSTVSGATYFVEYKSPNTNNVWKADMDYGSNGFGTATSYTAKRLGNNKYEFRVYSVNSAKVKSSPSAILTYTHSKTATETVKTYTIAYNANNGKDAPANQTKTKNIDLNLSAQKPTRDGYSFEGWGTSANSTNISYAAGGIYKKNADITLYAVWKANSSERFGSLTIKYNASGGSGAPASHSVLKSYNGAIFNLSSEEPTRSGYIFIGWLEDNNSENRIESPGARVTLAHGSPKSNSTVTFYAQWDAPKSTYSYDVGPAGGNYPPAPYFSYGGWEKIEYDNSMAFLGEIKRVTYYDETGKMVGYSVFERSVGYFKFTRKDYWYENGLMSYYVVNDLDQNGDVISAVFYD